jgi:hypothetical protein
MPFFPKFTSVVILALTALCAVSTFAGDQKVKATLVWGTDDEKPNDPHLKRADEQMVKGLRHFKWKNYFEVTNTAVNLSPNVTNRVRLSPKCEVELQNLGKAGLEAKLWGEGKLVYTKKGTIPAGEHLALGGDDPKNSSAWFVILTPLATPPGK